MAVMATATTTAKIADNISCFLFLLFFAPFFNLLSEWLTDWLVHRRPPFNVSLRATRDLSCCWFIRSFTHLLVRSPLASTCIHAYLHIHMYVHMNAYIHYMLVLVSIYVNFIQRCLTYRFAQCSTTSSFWGACQRSCRRRRCRWRPFSVGHQTTYFGCCCCYCHCYRQHFFVNFVQQTNQSYGNFQARRIVLARLVELPNGMDRWTFVIFVYLYLLPLRTTTHFSVNTNQPANQPASKQASQDTTKHLVRPHKATVNIRIYVCMYVYMHEIENTTAGTVAVALLLQTAYEYKIFMCIYTYTFTYTVDSCVVTWQPQKQRASSSRAVSSSKKLKSRKVEK